MQHLKILIVQTTRLYVPLVIKVSNPECLFFKTASPVATSQLITLTQQPENQSFALSLLDIKLITESNM